MSLIALLKRIPVDFGMENLKYTTKGKEIALAFVGQGSAGATLLDVGCRDGYFSRLFEKRGFTVTSIDIECKWDKCSVVDANKPLPYPDNSFDRIWCSEVIEHLIDPAKTIAEFRRVLKPGGIAAITTPNSTFWLYSVLRLFGKTPKDVQNKTHIHFFGKSDLQPLSPADSMIYGFFPYLGPRFRISRGVGLLSPTFVFAIRKQA